MITENKVIEIVLVDEFCWNFASERGEKPLWRTKSTDHCNRAMVTGRDNGCHLSVTTSARSPISSITTPLYTSAICPVIFLMPFRGANRFVELMPWV